MNTATISVMIVDDEPAIRNGMKNALNWQELGLVLTNLYSNGQEAFEAIKRNTPSIVITDLKMPKMTGLELIRKAKDEGINSHFIILSGYDDFKFAKEAISLGVENFLLKPLSRAELVDTLIKIKVKIQAEQKEFERYHDLANSAKLLYLHKLIAGETIEEKSIDEISKCKIKDNCPATIIVLQKDEKSKSILRETGFISYLESFDSEILTYENKYEICIINTDQTTSRHVAKVLLKIAFDCGSNYTISVGATVKSLDKLQVSFQSAMTALSYKIYDKDKKIFDSDSITSSTPTFGSNDIVNAELLHAIYLKDEKKIQQWTSNFFQKLMYVPTPPPSYIKGMCVFLLADINRQIQKEKHVDSKFLPKIDWTTINGLSSIDKIEQWMAKTFRYISNVSIVEAELANDPIIYRSRKMVADSIAFQISAKEIAENLNMNFAYFSSYYKQKTGENFSNYIIRLKNDYAKELLADPQLSIDEISNSLGYTDYRSFYRIFKKMNGITPSQYRSMI